MPKRANCIGTWNIRSMNQGKLKVVKQEMARVNIDILGISELKWTGMGKFNSDDHYIYYCGEESLRRNGVAIRVNNRVWNAVLECSFKYDSMISVLFQGKPFNITVIQVYAPTNNAEEAEVERFYEHLQDLLELTPPKDVFWSTEWSRAKANRVLPKEHTGHANTLFQQHKRRLYTWHQQMINTEKRLIIFFAVKDGEALYSQQKQDQELTVAQIMNTLLPNSDWNWRK